MTPARESHSETVRRTLSTNVMVSILARAGYLVTRFFVPPFVLARVSMEAYGLWATAFILVSYAGISTLGISNVYIKYVAQYSAAGDYRRANALLSTGLCATLPLAAVLFAAFWWCWPRILPFLHVSAALEGEARVVVLMVVGSFLASIALSAFSDALSGAQRLSAGQGIWVLAYLVETALIFTLVGMGRGVRGLAEAFALRMALEIGCSAALAFRVLPWLRLAPRRASREALRVIVSFGGVVQLTSLLAIALNSVERVLAAPLVGLEATGLLDIGKKLPSMAASIPSAFASSLTPAASYLEGGLSAEGDRTALHKLFLKGARYMNLAAAYFCGLLATASLPLLDVWLGRRYAGAAFLASVFAVATQVHLMTGPGTSVLKGLGRPREEFYYALPNVAALALLVPLSRAMLGRWSALGIGTAVAAATVMAAAYFISHSNRVMGLHAAVYWRRVVLPGVAPYAVALPLALPAAWAVAQVSRWEGAGIVVGLGVLYTAALALVVDRWVLDQGERLWFRAVVRTRLAGLKKHSPNRQ